jgi:hypothetical protein
MEKNLRLIFSLVIVLSLLIVAGCGDSTGKVDENIKNVKIDAKDFEEKEIEVELIEISGMKNESLQKKINENLKKAILSLVRKGGSNALEGEASIAFLNDRLMVVVFEGWTDGGDANGNHQILKGIHIDLTTGKIYDPTEIFKKNSKYEEEILEIAREESDFRLYSPGNENWQFGAFRSYWDKKKNNQFFILTDEYLWVYTFSVDEEGLVPGYGIPYEEIADLINTEGDLWKAFATTENRAEDFEAHTELLEFETDVEERAAREAAYAQAAAANKAENERRDAERKIAAAQKAAADAKTAQRAAEQKAANAQKAAAQKAVAQKAAAQKPVNVTWKTTKVVNNRDGTIGIEGQYINNTNKTLTRINWSKLTVHYKTRTGAQKSFTATINNPAERVAAPGRAVSARFWLRVPNDYYSFVKVGHQFNYNTR